MDQDSQGTLKTHTEALIRHPLEARGALTRTHSALAGARGALAGVWLELLAASLGALGVIWDPFGLLAMPFCAHMIDAMVEGLLSDRFWTRQNSQNRRFASMGARFSENP